MAAADTGSGDARRRSAQLHDSARRRWTAWNVFSTLVEHPDGAGTQSAAYRVFDRIVRQAQHGSLLGAAEDDDD